MEEQHNFQKLKSAVMEKSKSTDWETAKKEWKLVGIDNVDYPETCVCGHSPITEICTIKNNLTNETLDIGNRCVKRFMGINSDLLFAAIKRIKKDIEKSLNADAIIFFRKLGVISEKDYLFIDDTKGKRKLSEKQMKWRVDINRKVLAHISRRGI